MKRIALAIAPGVAKGARRVLLSAPLLSVVRERLSPDQLDRVIARAGADARVILALDREPEGPRRVARLALRLHCGTRTVSRAIRRLRRLGIVVEVAIGRPQRTDYRGSRRKHRRARGVTRVLLSAPPDPSPNSDTSDRLSAPEASQKSVTGGRLVPPYQPPHLRSDPAPQFQPNPPTLSRRVEASALRAEPGTSAALRAEFGRLGMEVLRGIQTEWAGQMVGRIQFAHCRGDAEAAVALREVLAHRIDPPVTIEEARRYFQRAADFPNQVGLRMPWRRFAKADTFLPWLKRERRVHARLVMQEHGPPLDERRERREARAACAELDAAARERETERR